MVQGSSEGGFVLKCDFDGNGSFGYHQPTGFIYGQEAVGACKVLCADPTTDVETAARERYRELQVSSVTSGSSNGSATTDVPTSFADLERAQNEAQTYANRVVPEARGKAAQILQNADAYKSQTVAEAVGQTSRFLKIYDEYKKAPDVTRKRMYLETMERILGGTDKIILDSKQSGSGVVPYLPLNELTRRPGGGTP
jgi:membrane protease subunit HflK